MEKELLNIFVSYAFKDLDLIDKIAKDLRKLANIYYWDGNKAPGEDDWNQIFGWIEKADLVFFIATKNTIKKGISIGQEIGYAKSRNIKIVSLLIGEVSENDIGCLKGKTPIYLSSNVHRIKNEMILNHSCPK